jgi:hypothetical protein
MMSGMPLEACWTFNKFWNNKFYYKVASCWLFLLSELYATFSSRQAPISVDGTSNLPHHTIRTHDPVLCLVFSCSCAYLVLRCSWNRRFLHAAVGLLRRALLVASRKEGVTRNLFTNTECIFRHVSIPFRKKLRADWSQGTLAIIRCRIFCFPVCYPKI